MKSFRAVQPNVRMRVTAMETPRQLQSLGDGVIDVGLIRSRTYYPDGVIARIVQRERLMIALATDHPLARHKTLKPAQLRGQPFISPQFSEMGGFAEYLTHLGRIGGFDGKPEYEVIDFITAISMAAAGYGVVLVPESIKAFAPLGLTFKKISDFDDEAPLALAYRARERSPCVKAFVSSVLSLYKVSEGRG
nr:LysR family substrate-binding domain-containing protein [Dyella flava]